MIFHNILLKDILLFCNEYENNIFIISSRLYERLEEEKGISFEEFKEIPKLKKFKILLNLS